MVLRSTSNEPSFQTPQILCHEPALVDVADGSTNDVVVRDERDVSYRRIAKLPTLMPIPMSGSLVIRQTSTHYAVFSMHGTDVRYETVNVAESTKPCMPVTMTT